MSKFFHVFYALLTASAPAWAPFVFHLAAVHPAFSGAAAAVAGWVLNFTTPPGKLAVPNGK